MTEKSHSEIEVLQTILEKLNKAEVKPVDVTIFNTEEVISIRRMMLTEEESKTLRAIIEYATGFKTAGKFLTWFKAAAMWVGWAVFGYMMLKGQVVDFIRGAKP